MKKWEVKFNDGFELVIDAVKYDPRIGSFLNEADEVIGQINFGVIAYVRVIGESA